MEAVWKRTMWKLISVRVGMETIEIVTPNPVPSAFVRDRLRSP